MRIALSSLSNESYFFNKTVNFLFDTFRFFHDSQNNTENMANGEWAFDSQE